MATTTNFGWDTPDDTDLVKDGAAAIRTLGSAIDTSFVDLKGGTTGQVLSKASNTDLDFTWATDATGIPATIFDAKGDLIAASAADTAARLAVGTNGQVLTADSAEATGMKWGTVSATKNFSLIGTGTLTGAATVTVSGLSNLDQIMIVIIGASTGSASDEIQMRFNSDSGSNYKLYGSRITGASTFANGNFKGSNMSSSYINIGTIGNNAGGRIFGSVFLTGGATAGKKMYIVNSAGDVNGGGTADQQLINAGGFWDNSSTITSVSLISSAASNFDAGTFEVYGAA